MSPLVEGLFDEGTNTITYLVRDPQSGHAVVIDPLLSYKSTNGRFDETSLDSLSQRIEEQGLTLDWILESHPHADHISGAKRLQARHGGRIAIGEGILQVQETWRRIYNLPDDGSIGAHCFDHLFGDGESFEFGNCQGQVLATPGHTPACVTYHIGDAAFVGDCVFMPDFGTARCDFPGGDARQLYRSVQRILSLPQETRIFVGHDYGPGGREIAWETTVAAELAENKQIGEGSNEEDFVVWREGRDANLSAPGLLLPALQINIRGGDLPLAEENGKHYLKIPLEQF